MIIYNAMNISKTFCYLFYLFFLSNVTWNCLCLQEKLMGHLGVVLYEYLGEEYPEVLGSILGALKVSKHTYRKLW